MKAGFPEYPSSIDDYIEFADGVLNELNCRERCYALLQDAETKAETFEDINKIAEFYRTQLFKFTECARLTI